MQLILVLICTMAVTAVAQPPADTSTTTLRDWYVKHYDFFTMPDTAYTIESELEIPDGFHRPDSASLSPFQNWVSHFPLWHKSKPVGIWKGRKAFEHNQISRAVHLPWPNRNFTDRAIPLRILAEFLHYQQHQLNLDIILTNEDTLRYHDWLQGDLKFTSRGRIFFEPTGPRPPDDYEYYRFLDFCMLHTSYASLQQNCDSVAETEVGPGDLYIARDERGRKGKVYVILAMLVNDDGERLFTVATGCSEACDFHIPLFNSNRRNPWITIDRIQELGEDWPHRGFYRLHRI